MSKNATLHLTFMVPGLFPSLIRPYSDPQWCFKWGLGYSFYLCIQYHVMSRQPPAGPEALQESDQYSRNLLSPWGSLAYLNLSVSFTLFHSQERGQGVGGTGIKESKGCLFSVANLALSLSRHHPMLAVPVVRVERLQRDLWEGHADPPADAQVSGRARGLQ